MKELIFFTEDNLKPMGGPAGYLYNLNNGLKSIVTDEIVFLPSQESRKQNHSLKNKIPFRLVQLRNAIRFSNMDKEKDKVLVNINQYDIIHFHRTDDLYRFRDKLKNYKGKVVLTSHTPCARHCELLSLLHPTDKKFLKKKLKCLEEIDQYAFERADYIVFPCVEAEEPYFHTWSYYGNIRDEKKMRYLPTGIEQCVARVSRSEIRKKYRIPDDAFVVCYVGRHNEIKGYDIIKQLAMSMFKNEDVYFLIAGKEEPLYGLKNEHWIEVGWTNDPHSIISAADVFVLPNRETYFDLIMLEVLSLGQIIVASKTGGNKFFEQYDCNGIMLYENPEELQKKLYLISNMTAQERNMLRNQNMQLYKDNFTVEIFARNYVKLMESL